MPETGTKGRSERKDKPNRSEADSFLTKETPKQSKTTTDTVAGRGTSIATPQVAHTVADSGPSTQDTGSELLKCGAMLLDSIRELKDTRAENFTQLHQSLTADQYDDGGEESDGDLLASDPESDHEPPNKRARETTADNDVESSELKGNRKVLTSIAEKLHMQKKVDSNVDSQLSTMINKLTFRKKNLTRKS